jgi:hypothetical protein
LEDLPPGHAAAAQPGVAVPRRMAHHQRAAVVRRGLPQHAGRSAERHHGPRLLPLRPGLPELQLRLRLSHRLFPVPHHPRGDRDPVPGRPAAAPGPPGAGGGCRSARGTWCWSRPRWC